MLNNSSFERSIDLLQRNMAVASLRRQVIMNNISNAETPNFKRSEVSFEAQLKRVLTSQEENSSIGVTTHEKHISFQKPVDYRRVEPRVTLDYLTTARNNGNNVDVDREVQSGVENQMMYELMTNAMSHLFRQVNIVLG